MTKQQSIAMTDPLKKWWKPSCKLPNPLYDSTVPEDPLVPATWRLQPIPWMVKKPFDADAHAAELGASDDHVGR